MGTTEAAIVMADGLEAEIDVLVHRLTHDLSNLELVADALLSEVEEGAPEELAGVSTCTQDMRRTVDDLAERLQRRTKVRHLIGGH